MKSAPQDIVFHEPNRRLRKLLGGERGAYHDAVVLNAGAALVIAGKAKDLRDGVVLASKALRDGATAKTLEKIIAAS